MCIRDRRRTDHTRTRCDRFPQTSPTAWGQARTQNRARDFPMATSRPSAQTDEKGIDDNESHPGNSDADRRRPARPRPTGNTPDVRKPSRIPDSTNSVARHREMDDSPRPGTIGTPVVTVPHSRFAPSPNSRSVFLPQDHPQAGLVSSHTTVSLGIPTIQFHSQAERDDSINRGRPVRPQVDTR